MKYFLVSEDERYQNKASITNVPMNQIRIEYLRDKKYHLFPAITILPIYSSKEIDFLDLVCFPFFMVSDTFMSTLKIYLPFLKSKTIILENANGHKTYKLPLIPRINCLTQNSKLSIDKSCIEYAELDYSKVKNHSVFYIGDITKNYVVMNLDILESVLKRGIRGISIKEIDVTEEVL